MATANICTPGHICESANAAGRCSEAFCSGTGAVLTNSRSRKPAGYGAREWLKDVEDDLAKLDKIKARQPKFYERNRAQNEFFRRRLESRIAALRADLEAAG